MDEIKSLLQSAYGITAHAIREVKGGCSARAFKADAEEGSYFVKAYDKSLPTVQPYIERIGTYMPVLDRLANQPGFAGHVPVPVLTLDGSYQCETDGHVYVLFEYIHGYTVGIDGVSEDRTVELAGILARLHETGYVHGDAHGNNVMQSDRLVLVDWEDLREGSPEEETCLFMTGIRMGSRCWKRIRKPAPGL